MAAHITLDVSSRCAILNTLKCPKSAEIKHVTGFATFQVPRGYVVVFREIRQENKTPPTMAKNGGPFRETAATLMANLPALMQIWLHRMT